MDRREDVVATMLERAVAAGLAPGWVALAASEGVDGTCWVAGRSGCLGTPVEPDLRYDLASLTKPLATGTLLLLALRDGLELEMPLAELLPELDGTPWQSVTVVQCATHTAGFPAWAPLYADAAPSAPSYLHALAKLEPASEPGTSVVYSCPGYIALGLALERAADADLATLFAELIATPLDIADEIGFAPPAGTPTALGQNRPEVELALLADRGVAGEPPEGPPGTVWCDDGNARGLGGAAGNAGLFGTAAAVARLAAEYLPGGGEILTSGEAELATANFTDTLEQARGLGWQLATTPGCSAGPGLPSLAFGHSGFTGTSVWTDPNSRDVLVLLGNRLHPGGRQPDLHPLRRRFHQVARLR